MAATHRRYGRTLAAAVVLAATTLLAGCGNGTAASPATGTPTSPATVTIPTAQQNTTTGGPAASTSGGFDVLANMPDAAKQHTNAGAQAFARYYIEAVGRLLMDPDTGQLPKLYLPQCEECRGQETNIAETLKRDVRWRGLYFRTLDVLGPTLNGEDVDAAQRTEVQMASHLTTDPVEVKEGSAPATTRPKGYDVLAQFRLSWREGQWYVSDLISKPFSGAAQ